MKGRILFGILLLAFGVGIFLNNLGIWDFSSALRTWWPIIIILVGLINMTDKKKDRGIDIVLIIIGAYILLFNLGIIGPNLLKFFWPSVLIIVGLLVLLRSNRHLENIQVNEDFVDHFVIFSGLKNYNVSRSFKGGRLTALFGGIDLDLRDAAIEGHEAEMEIFAAFGGAEIKVPENWRVVISGLPIFGGLENKTRVSQDVLGPTLKIKCTVLFGGFEVKN